MEGFFIPSSPEAFLALARHASDAGQVRSHATAMLPYDHVSKQKQCCYMTCQSKSNVAACSSSHALSVRPVALQLVVLLWYRFVFAQNGPTSYAMESPWPLLLSIKLQR